MRDSVLWDPAGAFWKGSVGMSKVVKAVGVILSLFTLASLIVYPIDPLIQRSTFVFLSTVMAFASQTDKREKRWEAILDISLIILSSVVWFYTVINFDGLIERAGVMPEKYDVLMGVILIGVLLEMARRMMGVSLPALGFLMILYALWGNYFPGLLRHSGFSLPRVVSYIYSLDGVFGSPLAVTITYVFIFSMFGAFMDATGGGRAIRDFSMMIAGRSRGGAAKVAVVACSLFGMINGSPVANVTATGSFTIPMMKKTGYSSAFAGAVAAVASTGGQILPPVMGASVFIMIGILGMSYGTVAIAATVPALMYYLAIFWMVDLEAQKDKLQGLRKDEVPSARSVFLEQGPALIPVPVLVYTLLVINMSPLRAGLISTISCVVISLFRKGHRINLRQTVDALYVTAKGTIMVTAAVCVAGAIVGVVGLTGLGLNMTNILLQYSGGTLILTLLLGMVALLILGIGMPTTGAYIIGATIIAPALINLGVMPLAAHLFILYFANLSNITPPVALAAYAASGISEASPMSVGVTAFKLGALGFIIPYVFVYNQALLLIGSLSEILYVIATALIGIFCIGFAIQGFCWRGLNPIERLVIFVASTQLILPRGMLITGISLLVLVGAVFWVKIGMKNAEKVVEPDGGSSV